MQKCQSAPGDGSTGRLSSLDDHLADLVGYRVLGRHGHLGIVEEPSSPDDDARLVVRGGVSDALLYHVPSRRILEISDERRTLTADVDAADFVPSLRDDGTVVLQLTC